MLCTVLSFFFNDTPTTEIYTLSLHDALPISTTILAQQHFGTFAERLRDQPFEIEHVSRFRAPAEQRDRSEEHTSELQSRQYLVCRLLLEKKKNNGHNNQ